MSLPAIPGYRLVQLLHEGSRAEVYLAEQRSLQRLVALKLLRPGMAGDPVARTQLIGEGKSAARMSHPNLLAVFDIGEVDGLPYIATEYLPKGTLRERLDRDFDSATVLRFARDLAQGLKYLHEQGFLHRDLKPSNIYFRDDGTAVLSDAGITRQDRALHPDDSYAWGSPYYMCPEQAQGDPTDARADLYSLGTILYEVLAGRPPFEGEDPMAIALAHVQDPPPPLPAETRAWQPLIDRLLAKSPSGRLPDADTLLVALDRISVRVLPAAASATPAPAPVATVVAAPLPAAPGPAETVVAATVPVQTGSRAAVPDPPATMVRPPLADAGATVVAPPVPPATPAYPPGLPSATVASVPMPPPVPLGGATVVRAPVTGAPSGGANPAVRRPSPWPWIVLSVVLVIGTVLLFVWWGSRSTANAPSASPPVAGNTAEREGTIDEWVRRAQNLEEREAWINTDETNAVQAWREVLRRDPNHPGAQAALARIREDTRRQIERARVRGQLTTALALLEQAALAFPDDAEFQTQLKELQAAAR